MNIRIVDKKRFVIFMVVFVLVMVGLFYGGYFLTARLMQKKEATKVENKKEDTVNSTVIVENETDKDDIENNIGDMYPKKEKAIENEMVDYENTTYKYALTFPEKWFMNNDDSGAALIKLETEYGMELAVGGQTFWSNYQNINNYDPQNKPEDFRLLSLTIYQDSAKGVDDFAKKLGFENDLVREEFATENAQGVQLVAQGLLAKNPRIMVLFQKGDRFFVFRPAFLNGDIAATDAMELIVKSFKFID